MCRCYKNEFFNLTGNACFMQCIHMKCKCRREHFSYVLFCGECTYRSKFGRENVEIESKCKCKDSRPQEVCSFCFTVRYLLNFKCYKLCVDTLPVVPLGEYLKKIDGDPFFLS